jgi:hypothetical protein
MYIASDNLIYTSDATNLLNDKDAFSKKFGTKYCNKVVIGGTWHSTFFLKPSNGLSQDSMISDMYQKLIKPGNTPLLTSNYVITGLSASTDIFSASIDLDDLKMLPYSKLLQTIQSKLINNDEYRDIIRQFAYYK